MKLLLYILILCAAILIPVRGADMGKLIPVEVIAISESRGTIMVNTDTGDRGQGATLEEAFSNLEDTAPGIIYLDTAEYLLLEPGVEDTGELARYLKRNIKVYQAGEDIPLDGIGKYLSVNQSDVRLKDMGKELRLPVIEEENGRYTMIRK